MNRFDYILDKIENSKFDEYPFNHVQVKNLFHEKDFNEIIKSQDIYVEEQTDDTSLLKSLLLKGYKVISFPGSVTNVKSYVKWHKDKQKVNLSNPVEGFGLVLRLYNPKSEVINELNEFLKSDAFIYCLSHKFKIDITQTKYDGGIQKYLDGYEISPHPDRRKKALTFMININPDIDSDSKNHHTHYCEFVKERRYVRSFWEGNEKIDRCWIPWDWTKTVFKQNENNSMVIFSPSDDTLHAVKTNYNHLISQRTQLYGNLWYKTDETISSNWNELDIINNIKQSNTRNIKSSMIYNLGRKIKRSFSRNTSLGKRNN